MTIDDVATTTRQRILAAAAECITRDGFAQVRMATIAKEAGVSTALLHYHFDTKEKLLADVLTYSYETSTILDKSALSNVDRSPAERLADYLDRCLPIDDDLVHDWLLWQEVALVALRQPELARLGSDLYDRMYSAIADMVTDGVEAGDFKPCDANEIAFTALALADGLGTRVLAQDPRLDLDHARRIIATTIGNLVGNDGPLPLPGVVAAKSRQSKSAAVLA